MREFTFAGLPPTRVVAGAGALNRLRDEVARLGAERALLVTTPDRAGLAERAREVLGSYGTAVFDGTGVLDAVAAAREHVADCLVTVGGGRAVGLSEALAATTGLPQVVVPVTYAGAQAAPAPRGSAGRAPATVVLDADLALALSVPEAVAGGVAAIGHAVEALYAAGANPVADQLALRAVELLGHALPAVAAGPADRTAHGDALEAAWLAGCARAAAGTGPLHAIGRTLTGAFGLPRTGTQAAVVPHLMAWAATAVPDVLRPVSRALGAADAPTVVHDLLDRLHGPLTLERLGLSAGDVERAAALVPAARYAGGRTMGREEVAAVLRAAHAGARPDPARPLDERLHVLAEQVAASFAATPDARLRTLMTGLVRHLHAFVAENDLTEDEWRYAVDFLTRTGHITSDVRQEFILLSDTLGVSSAVDLLTNSRTTGSTPSAVLGPFYVEGPPRREQGADIAEGLAGTPLYVSVRITDLDGAPLPGAVADVWQSDDDGFYDVQLPDLDGPVLRARFHADGDGRIAFRSILPSEYPIPSDGPVGEMLRAAGRHSYRAPHLHFMIGAPAHRRLVTQLFVAGGAYLDGDAVFGVKEALVVEFAEHTGPAPDGRPSAGPWRSLDHTFRLAPG